MPSREESGGDLHLKRWCALPEPYPEPMVLAPNQYYAMLLLEDYTGQVSEMTAINQYLYWSAGYVYYGCGICDRLAADIGAEIAAIQTYRQHQQRSPTPISSPCPAGSSWTRSTISSSSGRLTGNTARAVETVKKRMAFGPSIALSLDRRAARGPDRIRHAQSPFFSFSAM